MYHFEKGRMQLPSKGVWGVIRYSHPGFKGWIVPFRMISALALMGQ
jgi:hypothetical protein